MKQIALAIGIVMVASGLSLAADMAVKAAPGPVAVTSWTGCYLGAGGGYGMFNQKREVVAAATNPFAAGPNQLIASIAPAGTVYVPSESLGGEGWLATAQVGCDYQFASNWLIGAFVDGDWTNLRGDHGLFGAFRGEQSMRWSYAVGGRLGWLVTPSLLAFFSGGYTEAEFSGVNYSNISSTANVQIFSPPAVGLQVITTGNPGFALEAQRFSGFFIGGGTEYAISQLPGLFWKTEYRYADYRSAQSNIICPPCTVFGAGIVGPQTGLAERQHPTVQTIRTELVWRFNWGGPATVAKY